VEMTGHVIHRLRQNSANRITFKIALLLLPLVFLSFIENYYVRSSLMIVFYGLSISGVTPEFCDEKT